MVQMKNIILLTTIPFLLISCWHNNRHTEESNDPASEIASYNCDYMSLIKHELENLNSGNYQIKNVKVSNLSDQNENSTSIWFAVNAEVLFEDSARQIEYAFFFDRNCQIKASFNLNEGLDSKGFYLRIP